MTEQKAIKVLKSLVLCGSCTVGPCDDCERNLAKDAALLALEEIQKYRAIGTVEEFQRAIGRQKEVCEPEYMGENRGVGCRVGRCKCGNLVRSYQEFCDECGVRLEWGRTWSCTGTN